MAEPECPVQECRHMREIKKTLEQQGNILWLAIGLGVINIISQVMP